MILPLLAAAVLSGASCDPDPGFCTTVGIPAASTPAPIPDSAWVGVVVRISTTMTGQLAYSVYTSLWPTKDACLVHVAQQAGDLSRYNPTATVSLGDTPCEYERVN